MVIDPFKLYVIDLAAMLLFLLLQNLLSRHIDPKNKKDSLIHWLLPGYAQSFWFSLVV